jgi:hypothetical protein
VQSDAASEIGAERSASFDLVREPAMGELRGLIPYM